MTTLRRQLIYAALGIPTQQDLIEADVDIDIFLNAILTTNLRFEQMDANAFRLRNRLNTAYRHLRMNTLYPFNIEGLATNAVFRARPLDNSSWLLQARDNDTNVMTTCGRLQSASEPNINFERAGDITFVNGGLPYGCITVEGNVANTVIPGAGGAANKAQFTEFDTDGPENNCDADHTEDHIEISVAGDYYISCSCHIESVAGGGADTVMTELWINNGATHLDGFVTHHLLAAGGADMECMTMSGIAALSSGDTVELWFTNVTSGDDLLCRHASLSVVQVGS